MLEKLKSNKGFTLIEVVIVLAIGALIILVVLQAVSSAQRNQRDSARRQEAARVSAALESYAANNQGVYPVHTASAFNSFLQTYEQELYAKGWRWNGTVGSASTGYGCGTQNKITRHLRYHRQGARSYRLAVCLEQGAAIISQ